MKRFFLLLFGTSLVLFTYGQEEKQRNWTLNGYVKNMGTWSIFPDPRTGENINHYDNLVHNRLNFKWYPHQNWKLVAEMRNRLVYGRRRKNQSILL